MRDKIWYMAIILGIVGFAAGLGLAAVKKVTDPIIEQRIISEGIKPSLDKFMAPVGIDNDPIADRIKIDLGKDDRGRRRALTVFKGKKNGAVIAAALQTTTAGYGGDISVLSLLDLTSGKMLGVKTLSQSETPGLGARIADDDEPFIQQFPGMDIAGGIQLRSGGGKVDAISGASISSKAFADAVNKAVALSQEHSAKIKAP
ncbi:MAG: RnfABCDGE type electron transport complex subunit G [Myxococcota bacterium]|nr:RnfABCDGE type electron transport complex subunit G [Myxococcota bacterium]